jgi:hypothetical protein
MFYESVSICANDEAMRPDVSAVARSYEPTFTWANLKTFSGLVLMSL